MSLELEKSFLTINNDYPPDASRGFDVRRSSNISLRNHSSLHQLDAHAFTLCFRYMCAQLPSAVITLLPNTNHTTAADSASTQSALRFYTPGLLVLLPFPDMSMPFNVVAFTSTVLAFLFGSLFNLTYSTTADIVQRSKQTPLSRIKSKLAALLGRCRRTAKGAKEEGAGVAEPLGAAVNVQEEVEGKKAAEREDAEETAVVALQTSSNADVAATESTTRLRKVHVGTTALS